MNHHTEIEKSFGTLKEMARDRGVDDASFAALSGEDVLAIAANRNVFHVDAPSCGYRVIYDLNPKFKLADIRKLLEDDGPGVYVVVVRERPTHVAIKGIAELKKDVQFFDIRQLQFNVTRHVLQPRFEPMREPEAIADVLARYRLRSKQQLPAILSTDAVARYYALKPGQLVRITSASPSAGSYVSFRCCQRAVA